MNEICPRCKAPLVEVDNPMRRELRHRRGTTCRDVPVEALAVEFLPQSNATDEKFPEFAAARGVGGVCRICRCRRGEPHVMRRHDDWDAANNATW